MPIAPLPSKQYFSRNNSFTLNDELGKERIIEQGKAVTISPIDSEINGAWKNRETRALLVALFNGKRGANEIIGDFVDARIASAQKQHDVPFPFGEQKEIFIKYITSLKTLGLVKEVAAGMLFKNSPMEFSLTENGLDYVKKNLVETIKEENFEFFLIIMATPDSIIKVNHLLAKIIERKRLPVDPIIMIIRHRQPILTRSLIKEYTEYLNVVDHEHARTIDMNSLRDEVMKKVSGLVRVGMVTTDQSGSFSVNKAGQDWINTYTESMDPFMEFLKKMQMIDFKKEGDEFYIGLTEIGKVIGNEIDHVFRTDEHRILDRAKSIMGDIDDHETTAPLPIHHDIQKNIDHVAETTGTIYMQPVTDKPLSARWHEAAPAFVIFFSVICAMTAIVGLCLIPNNYATGTSMALGGGIAAIFLMMLYPWSINIPKIPHYINMKKEKKRYNSFMKRMVHGAKNT